MDSHVGLPCVDKTVEELEKMELIPFRRAIEAGIPAIMSTHILFPKIEPDRVPGTMSRKIITGLLKERLGFQGLVFTDCLEMNAIQKFYGTAKGMVEAFRAGVDLAEISSTFSLECDAVRYANEVAEQGGFDMDEMRASVKKIRDEVSSGICPRCKGKLILRDGPYGKFYGCANYPQCKFKKKMDDPN